MLSVIDAKYPQKEHRIDCKSVIHGSIKEEQFKGFRLSKVIISFDFGPCFVDKNYITIFAIDNESEIYYTSLSTLSSSIKVNPIIGPVCFENDGQVHHRLLLKLFQPAPTTSHLIPSNLYTNEETFTTAAPLPADIPKMKNDTNLSYEDSVNLFSETFKKLIDLASNNVAPTHDVIKKFEAISTLNDKLQLINFFTVNRNNHLITVGLDSIFSVLTELNKRDPELCAQALQQLLQLLQTIPPEGMIHESKQVITRMHDLLKTLRIEGNSTVSSYANACLVSLAIARGEPEMLFSAVKCLLCDEKENIPFNQLTSEFNPLPKNFQSMAFTVQKLVQNGTLNFDSYSFCNTPITDHSEFITFDLEYSGSFSSTEFTNDSNISKSCLNSDGSYLYILNNYGLFKVGTGLTETQTAKVLAVNEMLKFIDGSALIICHESLYLRRKHSTRLWVIDKETLREIGEIMLHASLTDGILFSDGKCFYQGTLDEQWNFMVGFWVALNEFLTAFIPQQDSTKLKF
uniref:Uncharacterized protein n=1 Tax=Panagrolaimus davidi TaxID=227884 RepID=A0A914QN41_9BILA